MKINLSSVKNILFDLGKVLLNLDFQASVSAFEKLNLSAEALDIGMVFADPVFLNFETGQTTAEEFKGRVRGILNNPDATRQQIEEAWYAMVLDIPEKRVQMLKRLAKNYDLFLFSNTNVIHTHRFKDEFREQYGFEFSSLFTRDFYSHDIQERKPDLSAFRKVTELSGINPEETLFIDDLKPNIDGAQKAGFKTFWLEDGMEIAELL